MSGDKCKSGKDSGMKEKLEKYAYIEVIYIF